MEEGKLHEPSKPADEVEKPKSQSIIISANGLKITSKLNPDAKEFYPAHLLQRNLYRQTFALSARCDPKVIPSVARPVAQPPGAMPSEADTDTDTVTVTVAADRTDEPAKVEDVVGSEAAGTPPIVAAAETVDETKDMEKVVEKEEVEQQEVTVEIVQSIGNANEAKATEDDKIAVESSSALVTAAEPAEQVDATAAPSAKSSSKPEDPPDGEKEGEEQEEEDIKLTEEPLAEDAPAAGTNSIPPEFSEAGSDEGVDNDLELSDDGEPSELPQIIEEIKENIGLCDGVVTESVGDVLDHSLMEQQKLQYGAEIVNQMEIIPENVEVLEVKAPPPTPTDELHESRLDQTLITRSLNEKPAKDEKKKGEKRSTTRKFASFGLGLSRKSTSAHTEKPATKNSTSTGMTRTKRISESLHNLSSSLKSKVDMKKSDGSSRLLPRSTTNIPRPPTRPRTLLSKSHNESNGVSRKDAISLKSTGSTDRSITSTNKTLNNKTSATSTKNADKPTTTMAAKSKDSPHKPQPRGTVASSLRQTEAQKRRNLFPNDDPEANIELSQFLFK